MSSIKSVSSVRSGADVLLEILENEGVEYIFGNPGTTELPLIDAFLRHPDVKYVFALQEASAVAMADGYAQAAKKPGFVNLHTAGGLGHGMGNLINAKVAQTPMVVTAGQQDLRHTLTDPLLYDDLVSIARPSVKWAQEVTNAAQLPVLLRRAFNDANAAPRGPVFLSLPMDVMEQMTDVSTDGRSQINRDYIAGSLDELAHELAIIPAGRIAIIAGDEIHDSDGSDEVVQLAELLGAHVYGSSFPARIPYPTAHALWRGNMPTNAKLISEILQNYDAILGLGGKSLITILYSEIPAIPAGCLVYQLSADPTDLGRTYETRFSTIGNIKASLQVLIPLLNAELRKHQINNQALLEAAKAEKAAKRLQLAESVQAAYDDAPISPLVAAYEAARVIGPEIAIVDEALATTHALRQSLNSDCPGQYSFFRGGALGWAMPAAVGFSLGRGRAPVVCFVGDGAAMYSPQALWTAAHEKLPITFVVMNNLEYNILKNFMRGQSHYTSAQTGNFVAMDIINPAVDYQALATSMGVTACKITKASEIAPAIEAAIKNGQTNLIEIMIGK
ncbi:thiamine pyrophosphate-dependent enzyme [Leeia sp. TBRC 13508]|uniref:Thiamine pyrophosphate-dependent enzyme n=1 Tax=Leeia speluncae TaxID=2884804 RepID=A0ABS8D9K1_9NEIS|nr:thiamine pyrophosphate-binding protein [Leeia speluncae]MCB6184870.1 thiamine pyrophosphate-dependent enzyme [Leeia speluncae]